MKRDEEYFDDNQDADHNADDADEYEHGERGDDGVNGDGDKRSLFKTFTKQNFD